MKCAPMQGNTAAHPVVKSHLATINSITIRSHRLTFAQLAAGPSEASTAKASETGG